MKIKKTISTHKFLALLMIIITVSSNSLFVQAATSNPQILAEELEQASVDTTNRKMTNEALNIAKDFSGFSDIYVNEHRYINEDVAVVEFEHDDSDFGYVLFKKMNDTFIPTEFILDEDVDYSSYLLSYMSTQEYESSSDYMLSKMENHAIMSSFILDNPVRISSNIIKNSTGRYACTVVAFTEIVEQNNLLKNNSRADTFNQLWADTKTSVLYTKDGIKYGSTNELNHISGMRKYVEREGKNLSTESTRSPDFSFFVDSIRKGRSCCLSYVVASPEDDFKHTVSVFSTYCRVSSDMKYYYYIGIADGWTSFPKYILYNEFDYKYAYAISFNIY